ncbi:MAG TPA: 50S ribosomal protein L6 [Dehalococcoidia bacterium]|jgi:large subunit ribosomal protein L6|nr:50S ribosomal protein L6 [Chloroflexota bacterium]MDP5877285.1 50S ribosomal protein L6 [Dehalococcoidia bacterium]MDP6273581.1 50S ribosomal protein L6 [Dehalococcoidia bacterium]MDP7159946.1 50S ribosomal protein L6 [Dehalococcoidia bacterium]MDP7212438.1 50S ribosomal protein L6 [Dehalococcoidia bacterium]|tara:strand:- start:501 stop:1046 length:546 start_codon:yes stop_codon:yes gene_type:complete
MSRIGGAPIPVPSGVDVKIDGSAVSVKGGNGELNFEFHDAMSIVLEDGVLTVSRPSDEPKHRALHGLTRSLLNNMVVGVSDGYERALDLIGTGYRVQQNGKGITLQLGFSHPVEVQPLGGITLEADGQVRVVVKGADKQAVGHQAAVIRKLRPPNAYTGKGVRYAGEQIHLKPGKSAARAE